MEAASKLKEIWRQKHLQCCGEDVRVKTYRIFPVGPDVGVVEAVPNAKTLQQLKRDCPWGSRKRERVLEFLQRDEGKLNRLAATTAGLLAMSYMFGLADGHGDNYMITEDDEYFRIDFGHNFGEQPMGPDAPRLWLPKAVRDWISIQPVCAALWTTTPFEQLKGTCNFMRGLTQKLGGPELISELSSKL